MKRLLLVALMLVLAAVPARADDATEVAAALRTSPVYQAARLDLVDVATLTGELSDTDPRVVLAVLDAAAASSADAAHRQAVDISEALDEPDTVVLVITASKHVGTAHGSRAGTRGVDSGDALAEELKSFGSKDFTKDTLTAFVTSFAERVTGQASSSAVNSDGSPIDTGGGSGTAWLVVGSVVVVAGLVAAAALLSVRRRRQHLEAGPTDAQPEGSLEAEVLGLGGDDSDA